MASRENAVGNSERGVSENSKVRICLRVRRTQSDFPFVDYRRNLGSQARRPDGCLAIGLVSGVFGFSWSLGAS